MIYPRNLYSTSKSLAVSIVGEIKKFAGKITDAGFAAMWVSTQTAIAKASCLLYAKIKALYDAIPLVLGDYTSATKDYIDIAEEDGVFYYTTGGYGTRGTLFRTENIDLSESSAAVAISADPNTIESFVLGDNINVIAYYNKGNNVKIYNKTWELLATIPSIATENINKIKKVNGYIVMFTDNAVITLPDQEIEEYTPNTISIGGIKDIDYYGGLCYWARNYYSGGSWNFALYTTATLAFVSETTVFNFGSSYGEAALTVNSNGILWNFSNYGGDAGTFKFFDGTTWTTKNITNIPDLDFDGSEPNPYFSVAVDTDGNFIAYSKAYVVNLTDTPTTPAEWTFKKTGLAQAESVPVNDIVFTAKGNAYFCDGKYIYAATAKETKIKSYKISSEILAGIGESTGITSAAVVKATYDSIITDTDGKTFSYDGTDWKLDGNTVDLADYGITVEGTAASGDTVIISYYNATITYYELSDGSAVCMPNQQTDLDKVFAEYGKHNFYVLDVENETVRTIRNNTDGYQYLNVGGSYVENTNEVL